MNESKKWLELVQKQEKRFKNAVNSVISQINKSYFEELESVPEKFSVDYILLNAYLHAYDFHDDFINNYVPTDLRESVKKCLTI
jgi:hypothetical protein